MKLRGDSYLFFSGIEAHKKHLELLQSIPRKEYGEAEKLFWHILRPLSHGFQNSWTNKLQSHRTDAPLASLALWTRDNMHAI